MDKELKSFIKQLRIPLYLVVLIWLVEAFEFITGISLTRFGIFPRDIEGLIGIITGPFIHSDWMHLISNTLPLFILTSVLIIFYEKVATGAFIIIWLFGGFFVWSFARDSYHIGASGLIYGLVSFVFWSGIFRGSSKSIILSLMVLIFYSGYFLGLAPKEGVSWESHMMGAFVGIVVAFIFKNIKEKDEMKEDIPYNTQRNYFLQRDVFEKTKLERWLEESMKQDQLNNIGNEL